MNLNNYAIANDGILDVGMIVYFILNSEWVIITRKDLNLETMCIEYDVLKVREKDDNSHCDLKLIERFGYQKQKASSFSLNDNYIEHGRYYWPEQE